MKNWNHKLQIKSHIKLGFYFVNLNSLSPNNCCIRSFFKCFPVHTLAQWGASEVTCLVPVVLAVMFRLVTAALCPTQPSDFPPPLDFWRCRGTTGLHGNKIITSLPSSCCRQAGAWPSAAATQQWLHTHTPHTDTHSTAAHAKPCELCQPEDHDHMSKQNLIGGCYLGFLINRF